MPKITPARLVERVYAEGRHSYSDGRGYIPFEGAPAKTQIPTPQWELDAKVNAPGPQRREDQQAPTYDNDVGKSWLRGYGRHPHFDSDPSGSPTRKK